VSGAARAVTEDAVGATLRADRAAQRVPGREQTVVPAIVEHHLAGDGRSARGRGHRRLGDGHQRLGRIGEIADLDRLGVRDRHAELGVIAIRPAVRHGRRLGGAVRFRDVVLHAAGSQERGRDRERRRSGSHAAHEGGKYTRFLHGK
jgi:hypothetical protein